MTPRTSQHLLAPLATQPCANAGTRATPWCSLPLHDSQSYLMQRTPCQGNLVLPTAQETVPGSSSASHYTSGLSSMLP